MARARRYEWAALQHNAAKIGLRCGSAFPNSNTLSELLQKRGMKKKEN